jgi:predicted PurR-regulated permease PerM
MESNPKIINFIIRFFFVGCLLAWCVVLIRPFIVITLWGAVLAIAIFPVFVWLKNRIGGRSKLAATIIALLGLAIVIGPVSLVATVLLHNAHNLVDSMSSGNLAVPPPPKDIASWPIIGQSLSNIWQRASVNLESLIHQFNPQILEFSKNLLFQATNAGLTLLKFIISIIIAVILILNAETLKRKLILFISKLSPDRGEVFLTLATTTIRSVTRGIIGVAIVQTLMVSTGLLVAKIPGAGLLTLACLFLTIIQIGPGLIVLPTIIFAWFNMNFFAALLFTIWMFSATLVDNILKPILMGQGLPVPIIVILIGVIGGTLAHGILGLFIGPVILILGYELVRAWVIEGTEKTLTVGDESPDL